MQRVGYDADEQRYTYQDADGSYWEGEEGARYGRLYRTGTRGQLPRAHGVDEVCTTFSLHVLQTLDLTNVMQFTRHICLNEAGGTGDTWPRSFY